MTILKKDKKFLGEMLYHRRVSMGLSLKDVSKKIGRSMTAVHKWEVNKYQPSPKSIFLLAKALNVRPGYFYSKEE